MPLKEKALLGEIYNPNYDEEIIALREKTQDLCFLYNNIKPSNTKERRDILKNILGSYGEEFLIEQPFRCDYGENIEIGERFYANYGLTILDGNKVTFGNDVFIGPNCSFYTACHPIDFKRRNQGFEWAFPISVGNNVWFGGNVVVLPGVKIGDNVVVGASSVVVSDIESNVLVVGNPALVVKKLNENGEINE